MAANSVFSNLFGTLPQLVAIIFLAIGWLISLVLQIFFKFKKEQFADETQQDSWFWWLTMMWFIASLYMVHYTPYTIAPAAQMQHVVYNASTVLGQKLILIASIIGLFHIKINGYKLGAFFYILWWFLVLASMLLCTAVHFLSIYIFIECISIASYFLVALPFTKQSSEAAIKYAIFGSVSSALMLYGISLYYGFTDSLFINQIQAVGMFVGVHGPLMVIACIFILGGILFKLSAFPYHLWVADVYESTPNPVVSLLSVVPKIAVIILLLKLMVIVSPQTQLILIIVALSSILIGNFSALVQSKIKRILAFSTIAQIGFLLLFAQKNTLIESYLLFYLIAYIPANMLLFFLVDKNTLAIPVINLNDLSGLGQKWPFWGVALIISCLSLIGLPPTGGFSAKLFLFVNISNLYNNSSNYLYLFILIFALLNTLIALAYYIKMPYFAFFKESNHNQNLKFGIYKAIFSFVLSAIVLILFFKSNILLNYLQQILY